jgi:UDP-GlcNAc:undecaprenyl-phosphate GlcNAc-1-phosphate transferase
VAALTFAAFIVRGVYRGLWLYTDLADLVRIAEAVACATLLAVGIVGLSPWFAGYSRAAIVLYGLLLFLTMAGSRLSFRAFSSLACRGRTKRVPVVIYGAGNGGEVVLLHCRKNPRVGYKPIGFVDDDPRKHGRAVLGLPVLGGVEQLDEILEHKPVQGCIIASLSVTSNDHGDQVRSLCQKRGLWVKQLRLEFVEEGLSLW